MASATPEDGEGTEVTGEPNVAERSGSVTGSGGADRFEADPMDAGSGAGDAVHGPPDTVAVVGETRRRRVAPGRRRTQDGSSAVVSEPTGAGAATGIDSGAGDVGAGDVGAGSSRAGGAGSGRQVGHGGVTGVVSGGEVRSTGPAVVRRSVAIVLAVTTVVFAVAAVGFAVAWSNLNGQQQSASQVRAVSRAFVLDLTNLTPGTVDARITDLLDASTGTFARQAKSFFDSGNPPVRQALVTAKAVEQGQIKSLQVEAVNGSTASALAVVDLAYKSAKITSLQSDVLRLNLDLVDTGSGWKVDNVTVLNGSTGGVLAPPSSSSSGGGSSAAASSPSSSSGSAGGVGSTGG